MIFLLGVGAVGAPVAGVALVFLVSGLRHGAWTSLVKLCRHPMRRGLHGPSSIPADGFWPFARCSVCGSRWVRTYVAAILGGLGGLGGRLLARVWRYEAPPNGDELERRWEAAHVRFGGEPSS